MSFVAAMKNLLGMEYQNAYLRKTMRKKRTVTVTVTPRLLGSARSSC